MNLKTILLTTILLSQASFAAPKSLKLSGGSVLFKAKGFPTFITIEGKGKKIEGMLNLEKNKLQGSFQVPLATLKTGLDLRDEHMTNNYLEVKKFPNASLTLMPFELKDKGTTKGKLKLHGVEKEVDVTYEKLSNDEGSLTIMASLNIKITDYAISIPNFQGITVADEVAITVKFKANKQ